MKNQYESIFIVTPVLSEAQYKEVVEKFKKFILNNEGEIIHNEEWGLKKLAYPIQKKTSGYYVLFEFKAYPNFIQKYETELRRDERILRFLTVKLDKYAIEYNKKRREQLAAKNNTPYK